MKTTCDVKNSSPIKEFNNYVSGNLAEDAIMVEFDNLTDSSVDLVYQVTRTNGNKRDMCFEGLMYNRENGYMYYAPDTSSNFIPLLNLKKLLEILIKDQFNKDVDLPKSAIDNYLQNTKMHNETENPFYVLLGELVNYYKKSSQRTIIGKLLTGKSNEMEIYVDRPAFDEFMTNLVTHITRTTKLFAKAMSSIEVNQAGVLNTQSEMCKATEFVFDTPAWQKVEKIVDNKKHNLMAELSTNVVFNPTSREWVDKLLDPKQDNGFAKLKDSDWEKYYKYLDVMNTQDLMSDEAYQIFSSLGNSMVNTDDLQGLTFDTPNKGKLFRASRVASMVNAVNKNKPSSKVVNQTLTSIDNDNDMLVDPAIFAMTDRLIKNLTNLLNKIYK